MENDKRLSTIQINLLLVTPTIASLVFTIQVILWPQMFIPQFTAKTWPPSPTSNPIVGLCWTLHLALLTFCCLYLMWANRPTNQPCGNVPQVWAFHLQADWFHQRGSPPHGRYVCPPRTAAPAECPHAAPTGSCSWWSPTAWKHTRCMRHALLQHGATSFIKMAAALPFLQSTHVCKLYLIYHLFFMGFPPLNSLDSKCLPPTPTGWLISQCILWRSKYANHWVGDLHFVQTRHGTNLSLPASLSTSSTCLRASSSRSLTRPFLSGYSTSSRCKQNQDLIHFGTK